MRIFQGIMGLVVGFLILKYSIQITDLLGKVDFAERYLRGGLAGTYTMYRLFGLAIMIFSFLYMFGGLGFLTSILGPLFGSSK